jgi:RNA ligase
MSKLQAFVQSHENWRELLSQEPYCLTLKDDGPYTIFTYDQTKSDFSLQEVKEARGIILRSDTFKVVCYPFKKFFNYNESRADKIDWTTARIQEKVDGSIIKVWWDDAWHVSTNGMIDAFTAGLSTPTEGFENFGQLAKEAFKNSGVEIEKLDKNYTWIFELVSIWNRIVIPYKTTEVYHIGARNNITEEEIDFDIGVKKPKQFDFSSWDEMLKTTESLPYDEEGYVVVDGQWNRVKVKSLAYLQAHHLKDNGVVNPNRVLELIKLGEDEEFLKYFPEYNEHFDKIRVKYLATLKSFKAIKPLVEEMKARLSTRKDFAMEVLTKPEQLRRYFFAYYDGRNDKVDQMFKEIECDDLIGEES